MHHFKWKQNVIPYLQQRAIYYKKRGIRWFDQSQNAVNWLQQNAGNVDLQNVKEFNCQRLEDTKIGSPKIDILLCSDETDRFPMYTLIHSIILNEKDTNYHRLNFHILVLDKMYMFKEEIMDLFAKYNLITFEFASIMEGNIECIENSGKMEEYMEYHDNSTSDRLNEGRLIEPMNFARF